ncbi:MAG TPA: YIP1 family protein [Bryobacteraceae bacterium]|jgi:hypothetical protein
MATISPDLPVPPESFADDMAGMPSFFIDPAGAARRVHSKWFWIGPLVVFSIVSVIVGIMLMPIVQHALEMNPPRPNVTPEQYQKGLAISAVIQKVFIYLAPAFRALLFALQAAILLAASSVMSVGAKFRQLFNLVAGCGLIQALAAIAALVVLKAKGEITSVAELQPALGLDIFLPEGTNKFVMAFLGYFSVFEIWWIVMLVLIFAAAFRVSKGKSLAAVAPLVLLNLLWKVGAAAFQR